LPVIATQMMLMNIINIPESGGGVSAFLC